jgi:hypothetical protein
MPLGGEMMKGGRRGVPVKTLKKILKKAGLKTSGKKATLTRRAKKAHLKMRGGVDDEVMAGGVGETGIGMEGDGAEGGRRRRRGSRKSYGLRLY